MVYLIEKQVVLPPRSAQSVLAPHSSYCLLKLCRQTTLLPPPQLRNTDREIPAHSGSSSYRIANDLHPWDIHDGIHISLEPASVAIDLAHKKFRNDQNWLVIDGHV